MRGSLYHESLDEDITVRDAADYVTTHEECLQGKGWGIGTAFCKLRTTREILSVWCVLQCLCVPVQGR